MVIFHQEVPSHLLEFGGTSLLQQLHLHQPGGGEVALPQQLHLHQGGAGAVVGLSRAYQQLHLHHAGGGEVDVSLLPLHHHSHWGGDKSAFLVLTRPQHHLHPSNGCDAGAQGLSLVLSLPDYSSTPLSSVPIPRFQASVQPS